MSILEEPFIEPRDDLDSSSTAVPDQDDERRSLFTLEQLDIQCSDRILEVGFGLGKTLQKLGKFVDKQVELKGIERDVHAFRKAYHSNQAAIERGEIDIYHTCLWDFQTPEDYYHTIYTNNVHVMWENPITEFRFMRELLAVGGKLVTIFNPVTAQNHEEVIFKAYELVEQYVEAGFEEIHVAYDNEQQMNAKTLISVVGYK